MASHGLVVGLVIPSLVGLLVACREPEPEPSPPAPASLATAEAELTRTAHARGYLAYDPHATLAARTAITWRHGEIVLRPLTGTLVVVAEDLRLPVDGYDFVLARTWAPSLDRQAPLAHAWDEHLGLGPASPRCALGAACDAAGRVLAFAEGGRVFTVSHDADRITIASAGHAFVELTRDALRARGLAMSPSDPTRWPIVITYRRDASGRLAAVERAGREIAYSYDAAGRLVAIAQPNGATTRLAYDDAGRVTALTGPGLLATRLVNASPSAALRADVTIEDALGDKTRVTWSRPRSDGAGEVVAGAGPRAARWVFDAQDRLLAHVAAGARTTFAYDAEGRLTAVEPPGGPRQTLERDPSGRLIAVVEADQRVTFTYTPQGRLASLGTSERDRETWTWSGDDPPRLVRLAHASGRFEAFSHDALGRVVRYETSAGLVDAPTYDAASGFIASVRDERDDVRAFTYDAAGRLIGLTHPDGANETWTRDALGRPLTHSAADGSTTRFSYDALGQLVALDHPGGAVRWRFDALGRPLAEETPLGTATYTWQGPDLTAVTLSDGRTVGRTFDAFGRLVAETWSDGHAQHITWATPEDGGRLLALEIPGRLTRRFTWDAHGRLARLEERGPAPAPARDLRVTHKPDGAFELSEAHTGATWTYRRLTPGVVVLSGASTLSGAVEAYRYDARGRLQERTSSLGLALSLTHDARARPIVVERPGAAALRLSWNDAGLLAAIASDDALTRRFDYDAGARLVAVSEGDARWRLTYEGRDLVRLVDPAERTTDFTYDAAHRLVSRTSPATGTTHFTWDTAGRQASQRHADGRVETFTWDTLGRLVQRAVDGVPVRTLTWDAAGRVASDYTPSHRTRYTWDAAAVRRTSFDSRGFTTTRTGDVAGRTRAIDLNVRPAARYRWRSDGLLARVEGPSGFAVDLEHDAFGRRTALRLSAATLRYRHDAQRRLVGLEVVGRDGPTWSAGFTYDAAGRLAVVTSAGRSMTYGYDAAGRIATFIAPDATRRTYAFDAAGDLVAKSGVALALDAAGRPASERGYDAVGRAVTLPGMWSLRYDAAGHLIAAERPGTRIDYIYDGAGRLVSRAQDGALTHTFVRDGGDLVRVDVDGVELQLVPGELPGERFGFVADGLSRYLVQGPDGATLAVIDEAGNVVGQHLFEPFGEPLVTEGSAPDLLAARGHFRDPVTGLVHHPMRWYDPRVGAFLGPDPDAGDAMDPATLGRYAYLLGDPVNHVDPLGAQAHEWGPSTCLEAVCKLFRAGRIEAVHTTRVIDDAYTYFGAIEKNGWTYDIWAKRVPGTDRVLTLFHDLGERAEGPFGGAGPYQNIVLDPDGPRKLQPAASAVQQTVTAAPKSPGLFSRIGSTIRGGYEQAKIGVQLYGKEATTTVAGLGGLSGTLGTSVGTLAALPGGGLIIAAGAAVAGAIGYGLGTVINLLPGVAEGTQAVVGKLLGYDKDQLIANLEADAANEGERAKELRAKEIEKNIARDTMPQPFEPGVAGGTIDLGAPGGVLRDPDRAAGDDETPAGVPGDEGDDEEGQDDEADEDEEQEDEHGAEDDAPPPVESEILKRVAARRISFSFTHESDVSAGEFANIVTCTETITFWNVGSLVPGYGSASWKGACVASLNQSRMDTSEIGTFSGGPAGAITFTGEGGSLVFKLVDGTSVKGGPFGAHALPAGAFADWPPDL